MQAAPLTGFRAPHSPFIMTVPEDLSPGGGGYVEKNKSDPQRLLNTGGLSVYMFTSVIMWRDPRLTRMGKDGCPVKREQPA